MGSGTPLTVVFLIWATCCGFAAAADQAEQPWRALPLIEDGKVAAGWTHIGWGGFTAIKGTLRTDCDEQGMGLLVYSRERLGNCQIRVVYKPQDAK